MMMFRRAVVVLGMAAVGCAAPSDMTAPDPVAAACPAQCVIQGTAVASCTVVAIYPGDDGTHYSCPGGVDMLVRSWYEGGQCDVWYEIDVEGNMVSVGRQTCE